MTEEPNEPIGAGAVLWTVMAWAWLLVGVMAYCIGSNGWSPWR